MNTGRGVRVAVIDSGVNPSHPHIGRIAGGYPADDYIDVLGHGTAVMAAIQEKAPDADYFAVRVFRTALRTGIDSLIQAIDWSIENGMHVINLSLGTANPAHAARFAPLIARAVEAGVVLVAARDALPGSMPGVIGAGLDWDCPRESYVMKDGELFASGYPRPVPGVPVTRNLSGASFAVANASGFVVLAFDALMRRTKEDILQELGNASRLRP